jgi:threonine efflux protein
MSVLLTIAAVHLAGMAVPGPNVLTVSQTAIARSRPAAVAVALGVATAALIWATTAAAGLALLLSSIGGLSVALRIAGATVLLIFGIRLIADRESAPTETTHQGERLGRFFVKGVLVNLSNPKSLVYFTSVFTALIPADASPAIRVAAVVIVVAEAATWHSLVAFLFSRRHPRRLYARLGAWIERTVGGIFALLAARLLWGATR